MSDFTKNKGMNFVPFSSFIDHSFWETLAKKKLEILKLDETCNELKGFYSNSLRPQIPSCLTVDGRSFENSDGCATEFPALGKLFVYNTLSNFQEVDKNSLLNSYGSQLWGDIRGGSALENPQLLSVFLLLVFADLKRYRFTYWFAFPALSLGAESVLLKETKALAEHFTPTQIDSLSSAFSKKPMGFFLIIPSDGVVSIQPISEWNALISSGIQTVSHFCQPMIGLADPSTVGGFPGWPLRNLLALIRCHWTSPAVATHFHIVSFRHYTYQGSRHSEHSLVLSIQFPPIDSRRDGGIPKCVGWEKNAKGKFGPRSADLSASMDPVRVARALTDSLASSAVDLNLKLMKWRLAPAVDLAVVARARCLLLGSGTLGCNVARALLGWGVRRITFVDNGRVSFSNPVRQSLFQFSHCLDGGLSKAQCAADSLRLISPGVETRGVQLTIPMPGHSVTEARVDEVRRSCAELERLIDEHDAIFLLLDTREGRWLPSVLGAARGKIVVNAALGFNSFLVMRHGFRGAVQSETNQQAGSLRTGLIAGDELGCYFCNDVVAPGNSSLDRTLDQQCTVSRPGLSMLASGYLVELFVSLLQHPLGARAPAEERVSDVEAAEEDTSCLGLVPHQMRGFLSRFASILPTSRAFSQCTACSQPVLDRYRRDGFNFLLLAFNNPTILEELTGLDRLHAFSETAEVMSADDCESFELSSSDVD